MKRLLVPVLPEAPTAPAVLRAAFAIARQYGSEIAAVPFAGIEYLSVGEFFSEAELTLFEERRAAMSSAAERLFRDEVSRASTAEATPPLEAGWVGTHAGLTVPEYARAFDMVVAGLPGQRPALGATALLEGCLFESGRPVLVIPPSWQGGCGRTVAVAWNGSSETARTLAFAMPLLANAEKVTVIQIEGVGVNGPPAADIAANLRRHGITVASRTSPLKSRSPGEAFLREAEDVGADLMIKGAYTQSRLRQMIFGGATAYLLAQATMPMVMAN